MTLETVTVYKQTHLSNNKAEIDIVYRGELMGDSVLSESDRSMLIDYVEMIIFDELSTLSALDVSYKVFHAVSMFDHLNQSETSRHRSIYKVSVTIDGETAVTFIEQGGLCV